MTIITYNPSNKPTLEQKNEFANFLFEHLGKYGDTLDAIQKAISYALQENTSFGGFVFVATLENKIVGVTVVNQTGMKDYIPENILVYIATHQEVRGQGIGKKLMQAAMDTCTGNIALHVEPDNPAKKLYEKLGFENKYLEMRLIR